MCGIAGVFRRNGRIDVDTFRSMTRLISHRGPDDEGYLLGNTGTGAYVTAGDRDTPSSVYGSSPYAPRCDLSRFTGGNYDLALSNRRLSILDLSPAGHQPMANEAGTIWAVYNGEIYNYREIRDDLRKRGYEFHSDSDTEVLIRAYEKWDLDCLLRLNGMWAFCIWDLRKKRLFLSRDRLGVKPFYYYLDRDLFAFSSEIKPLLRIGIKKEANDPLIYDFLRHGLLDHTDETLFRGIRKLSQGHYMTVGLPEGQTNTGHYWDIRVSNSLDTERPDSEYAKEFLDLFVDAVRLRLRSDVPVGSCLSGGLDSSSIVCIASDLLSQNGNMALSTGRQKTFSSCFDDPRFDERNYIGQVISRTRANANYIFPGPERFLDETDNLLWHQEEPFGGTSIYAQWCVMRRAAESGIKVILDGQGADEQLAGYRKFYIFYLQEILRTKRYMKLLDFIKFVLSFEVIRTLNIRQGLRYSRISGRMVPMDLFRESFWDDFNDRLTPFNYEGDLGRCMRNDLLEFSLPVLLRYEDKNSMAHSVEARLPFLDYRIVEALASYPVVQKMRNGWTKYVLRNAMKGILPEGIRLRKSKLGFVTPEDSWFRDSLSEEVKQVFSGSGFISRYVHVERLQEYFNRYLEKKTFCGIDIFFRFFILEKWFRVFIDSAEYKVLTADR